MEWTLIGKKDPQLPQVRSLNHRRRGRGGGGVEWGIFTIMGFYFGGRFYVKKYCFLLFCKEFHYCFIKFRTIAKKTFFKI